MIGMKRDDGEGESEEEGKRGGEKEKVELKRVVPAAFGLPATIQSFHEILRSKRRCLSTATGWRGCDWPSGARWQGRQGRFLAHPTRVWLSVGCLLAPHHPGSHRPRSLPCKEAGEGCRMRSTWFSPNLFLYWWGEAEQVTPLPPSAWPTTEATKAALL